MNDKTKKTNRKLPQILSVETVAKSRLFHVQSMHLKFANGEQRHYERLKAGSRGAVMLVPMLDEKTVLLIREYAAGVERYELALPKGLIEENETVEQAGNRELKEEIGYGARQLSFLCQLSLAPGYLSHKMTVLLAQDLYAEKLQGDEPEVIEVVPWSLDNIDELLQRDDFTEARSIAAILMVERSLL